MLQGFAERLAQERREKAVRERRDILQKDVAADLGTTATSYSRWESGQYVPNDDVIRQIAAYFGVTPGWLRYGQEPKRVDLPTVLPDPMKDRKLTAQEISRAARKAESEQRASAKRAKPTKRRRGGGSG